jgi:polyketide biosynthesis enoyl-CoA hydratase PksH
LSRAGLRRYKSFRAGLHGSPEADREAALAANRAMFSDPKVRQDIRRYVTEGRFPWEP